MGKPLIDCGWQADDGPVRNQLLCDRMIEIPLEVWATRSGVDTKTLARLAYLHLSPFIAIEPLSARTYTPEALRIAFALGAAPEEIFPAALYLPGLASEDVPRVQEPRRVPVPAAVLFRDRKQDPGRDVELAELKRILGWALGTLPRRQHQVIAYLYGLEGESEHTVRECAEKFAITSTTVKYIQFEVRRKFRHPSRSRWIRRVAYLPQEDPEPLARLAG